MDGGVVLFYEFGIYLIVHLYATIVCLFFSLCFPLLLRLRLFLCKFACLLHRLLAIHLGSTHLDPSVSLHHTSIYLPTYLLTHLPTTNHTFCNTYLT